MWRCVLALSVGWLVLKGCWQSNFFPCKPRNKDRNCESVAIASPDTYIFVSTLHHFCNSKYFDLEQLWFVSGQGNSRTFFPFMISPIIEIRTYLKIYQQSMSSLDVIQLAKLVQKAELSGKEQIVTSYCMHLAGMHRVVKLLPIMRSFSYSV